MSQFIPEAFRFDKPLSLNQYLVGGEIKEWGGSVIDVNSTIASNDSTSSTYLGSIPDMDEASALEALQAASAAYD